MIAEIANGRAADCLTEIEEGSHRTPLLGGQANGGGIVWQGE